MPDEAELTVPAKPKEEPPVRVKSGKKEKNKQKAKEEKEKERKEQEKKEEKMEGLSILV